MTRKLATHLFLLASCVFVLSSCEPKEFARDTIIYGEFIDQDGSPVEEFLIRFLGDERGPSGRTKFYTEAYTDSLGKFKFTQRIPKGTDLVVLFLEGTNNHSPIQQFELYHQVDLEYEFLKSHDFYIQRDQWGKSIELKFKMKHLAMDR